MPKTGAQGHQKLCNNPVLIETALAIICTAKAQPLREEQLRLDFCE